MSPQTDAAGRQTQAALRADRVDDRARSKAILLTPAMGGADGISEMSRQWVRALESLKGDTLESLDVISLGDRRRPERGLDPATGFRTAGGSRLQFASFALGHAIRKPSDTIVVVMHLHLLPVALPLVLRGARLVVVLMGIEAWKPLRVMEREALRRAWRIVAISAHTIRQFCDANPLFSHIPIAVCPPVAPVKPVPTGAPVTSAYALIVGRMNSEERYKGHDALIELWPRVREAVPDARLVIAGDGDDATRLRKKAQMSGAEGVVFAGRVSDSRLAALYRDATFFVMPSTQEGFGLVYLEAMSAATPCIASPGAPEEIIRDGIDGVIVDSANRNALCDAMVRLFLDRPMRMRMAAAAAERVRRHFGSSGVAVRVRNVLDSEC
jgi:phosphatidylinositol alpha-1,6-mannosyltransferase